MHRLTTDQSAGSQGIFKLLLNLIKKLAIRFVYFVINDLTTFSTYTVFYIYYISDINIEHSILWYDIIERLVTATRTFWLLLFFLQLLETLFASVILTDLT